MHLQSILPILATATGITAAPAALQPRQVVPHDSLMPLPEAVPTTAVGDAIRQFQPFLHIAHGCQVMTAVGVNGETNGGLQDSGSSTGGCRFTDRGQTYVRTAIHEDRLAIMYCWYWPKDQPMDGNTAGGHRHDWECIVVWATNPGYGAPQLIGASASGHGDYKPTTDPPREGDRVKVEYFNRFPTNHELQFTDTQGWEFPMVEWHSLPDPARQALTDTSFGAANVPFKDDNFYRNLAEAAV